MSRLIAAIDTKLGMANEKGIPWQGLIPSDARHFRDQTAEGMILMGFGTYKEFDRPLHERENFVVSRPGTGALRSGFTEVADTGAFLGQHQDDLVWVIGGAALFADTIAAADELYLTRLDDDFSCTKFFPDFEDAFVLTSKGESRIESDISFHFEVWQRRDQQM